jgi:outer membrane murein-binding lipoprotein Lpp
MPRDRLRNAFLLALLGVMVVLSIVTVRLPPGWVSSVSLPCFLPGCRSAADQISWLEAHVATLESEVDDLALKWKSARSDGLASLGRVAELEQQLADARALVGSLESELESVRLRDVGLDVGPGSVALGPAPP